MTRRAVVDAKRVVVKVGSSSLTTAAGGLDPSFSGDGVGRYRSELESAVYFCCLEALQNASKHAGAGARISIRLQATDRLLLFQVSDDGVGFDRVPAHDGVGLRNMRDRVDAFDGRLEITSARGRGTAISGALPIA